ncbi:MAG TPA: trypsin-like serine protease [Anaerolineales bacterium]|nr:trypsin-like serine protease [Anaerolineales bacterium]
MNKKLLFAVFSVLAILAMVVSPAYAITGNFVEDFEHPFVGLVVFYDANGEFIWRCSGALLSPTVFLTAGHCADTEGGAVTARIYFQQDAGVNLDLTTGVDPVTGYPEYCAEGTLGVTCATVSEGNIYNFDYTGRLPNTHDVGILILDQPIQLSEYGELPEPNFLNQFATARGTQDILFTVSGYGLTYKEQIHNGKPNISFRERLMAEATLVNLNSALNAGFNLQTNGNGAGKGGTCNGDSGGPVFFGEFSSNLIVGVTSFGLNNLCRGSDFAYRIDQPEVLAWIESFL